MESKMKSKNDKSDENSLGILNMDNLKVFGESLDHTNSTNSSNNTSRSGRMHERLKAERLRALETLEKTNKLDKKPMKSHLAANKENMRLSSNGTTNATPTPNKSQRLNQTEYVSQRRTGNINISDLMTDETIHLENSVPGSRAASSGSKISFEPTEITGRSTLYHSELKMPRSASGTECRLSVSEILASSFAPKTRKLGELLTATTTETTVRNGNENTQSRASTTNSGLISFNGTAKHSLPRTADISKTTCSELSMEGCGGAFSFARGSENDNLNTFDSDEFEPGERMESRLIKDEIAWAEEFAAIPNAALSEQAKTKVETAPVDDFISNCSSMFACDSDFSMGNFFKMRSDNIRNIVSVESPDKCRTPVALVDSDVDATPKVDDKTYSKVSSSHVKAAPPATSKHQLDKHEDKETGLESHASYLLSVTAIERALKNLVYHADDSDGGVVKMLMSQAMQTRPIKSPVRDLPPEEPEPIVDAFESIADLLSENKENLDPEAIRAAAQFSDTKSFTESFLNSSDMKHLDRSRSSQPRSPLSPLQIPQAPPEIKISELDVENEADIDEWPSTPIKSPHRRVRRSKSPVNQQHENKISPVPAVKTSHSPVQIVVKNMENRTPTKNVKSPTIVVVSAAPPKPPGKSLSSTRLESDKSDDFGISPNLSHASNKNGVNGGSGGAGGGGSNNTTPRTHMRKDVTSTTITPVSSPRSCISCTSEDYHSPQMDTSFRSDGRYLLAHGGARTAGNSPVSSEASTRYRFANTNANAHANERKCHAAGVPPSRSCSYNSLKSAGPTSVRSTSRCSNSSEFSHRDGKIIPLKVTTLELSWSSSKLRKNARKSMQVKNTADKRLVLRIEVSGPGFELINAHGKTLSLQSQECRSIVINFCPTVTGAANGSLAFYAPHDCGANCNAPLLEIPLNGYGGNAAITTQNISVSPGGAAFLTMGQLHELNAPLERTFRIHNRGPLQGFAMIVLDSNGLDLSRLCDALSVQPQLLLLAPGETAVVRVVFRPRRDDIRKIIKKIRKVMTVANMRVISGDEANRQRIRRLLQRMSALERTKLSGTTLDQLWARFPNEPDYGAELQHFKEQPSVAFDLVSAQQVHEIALTLNNERLDETSETSSLYDGDETVLFHTVCAASPTPTQTPSPQHMLYPVDEEHSVVGERERVEGSWSVEPSVLQFDFREERGAALRICNGYKSPQYFEVSCSHKHWLTFAPSEGYVQPDGGLMEILVQPPLQLPPRAISRDEQILIIVSMENERITVPVKFPHTASASH